MFLALGSPCAWSAYRHRTEPATQQPGARKGMFPVAREPAWRGGLEVPLLGSRRYDVGASGMETGGALDDERRDVGWSLVGHQ